MADGTDSAKNKWALVTGGNRGVGLAIVTTLLRDSQMHVMLGCRAVEKGKAALRGVLQAMPEDTRHECEARACVVPVDVTDEDSVRALAKYISEHHHNRLDVLINNAGIASKSADPVELEPAKRTLQVNYRGMRRVSEALAPALQAARGRIVNACSMAGRLRRYSADVRAMFERANTDLTLAELDEALDRWLDAVQHGQHEDKGWGDSMYAVSKSAAIAYSKILARQLSPEVAVVACCPGSVKTDMNPRGSKTPAEGADTPCWLAQAALQDLTAGEFYQERAPLKW